MTRYTTQFVGAIVVMWLIGASGALGQMMPPAQYEGLWELQPNGDVKVTRKFTLTMQMYTMWKNAGADMLQARALASDRSGIVVTDKKSNWDDLGRTLTMSMTVLGMAQNKGNHWEAKVMPGLEFSNLDEGKKIAYFHFAASYAMGEVKGQDQIILPAQALKPSWDSSAGAVLYTMPTEQAKSGGALGYWIAFAACFAIGAILWVISFCLPSARASA
jgi:hypothetical protein